MRTFFLSIPLLTLAACSHNPASNSNSNQTAFVQGKATVLEVNNTLGIAQLKIKGKIVDAYWQTEIQVAQEGAIADNGPFGQAVGNYNEPYSHHLDLPAKVGDTIVFRAMRTGNELLLRSVQVVPN